MRSRLAITHPPGSSRTFMYVPERQGKIRVYDIHRGDVVTSLCGHMGAVNSCVYRPSNQELYSGGHDGLIVRWSSKSSSGSIRRTHDDEDGEEKDDWSSDDE